MGREYAPKALLGICAQVQESLPSTKQGGVKGNDAHTYGYHRSRNALKAAGKTKDYSIQDDERDKEGDGNACSAFDLTPNDVELRKMTARMAAAMRLGDERIVGKLREFAGTLDSKTVYARNVEFQRALNFDSTHLWHFHGSVFRKFANDFDVANGFAAVLAGETATPYVWDGVEYPGSSRFYIGAEGPWITWLGQRLVAHGYTGYTTGPGPVFTTKDRDGVRWAQAQQGFTGADADGYPGAATWKWLAADPATPPPAPAYPAPTSGKVYLSRLTPGRKDSDSVWYVQNVLRAKGFDADLTAAYDEALTGAVSRWQRSIGDDVTGTLGPKQLALLLKDSGVQIAKETPDPQPEPEPPGLPTKPWAVLDAAKMPGVVTYLQDFEYLPETEEFLLAQDRKGDTYFTRFNRQGVPIDQMTVVYGGHGSSFRAYVNHAGRAQVLTWMKEVTHAFPWRNGGAVGGRSLGTESRPTGAPVGFCGMRQADAEYETLSLYPLDNVLVSKWAGRLKRVRLKKLPASATQQTWAVDEERVYRLSGHTAKPAGTGKQTLEVFNWSGERLQSVDVTELFVKSTSDEPEGLSFDAAGNLLLGKREGGTKPNRSYVIWRILKGFFKE